MTGSSPADSHLLVARPLIEEVAGYVGFDESDALLLRELGPHLRPRFEPIIDRFYESIEANPGAAEVITGGQAQIERLKGTLIDWMEGLVGGVYDDAYWERRARIGRVHVRIGLDQRYMFSAMNLIREGLHEALENSDFDGERVAGAHRAIDRICDIELAMMLETYREAYVARIRSTERLATLGQLAASIGHDLRNPLAVIETSLHLLRRRVTEDPRAVRHLGRIGDQVALCGSIISDLLELARDREPIRTAAPFGPLVEEALGAVPGSPGVSVEMDIPEGLPPVRVDAGQLRQVVVNLVSNAVQAAEQDGRDAGERGAVQVRAWAEGDALLFAVRDDGPGLTDEARARLFEPLFTTRAKGIGLGLALCKRIVDKHGGSIHGHNHGGGGAEFIVRLPGSLEEAE